jgi:16S rRNA (adenine1518-N6/adenine1519-N6)-dimethyltransferase
VEIGTGTGVLTEPLLELFPQLLSLDIDERAVQHTRIRIAECGRFPLESVPQLQSRVQRADFLRQSWMSEYDRGRDTGPQVTLVGNLPYYIVSPILFHCFEHVHLYRRAFFMVQREFAERISAQPRCKDYGVLSVLAQLYAQTETLFQVPRTAFYPVPKVDSVVLRLELHRLSVTNDTSCRISTTNFDLALRQVVRQAFQQRRKTLRNVLGDGLPRQWRHCRAEELEPFDYLELAAWSLRDKECGLLDELHAPTTTDEDRHKPAR